MNSYLTGDLSCRCSNDTTVNACLILQYHRVAWLEHDPLQLAVEPYRFESQMEYLAENFNVIPIDKLKFYLQTVIPFPPRTVVVTFDGGYADLVYTAKEILERFEICATVFPFSANMIKQEQSWWDTLEDYLIASSSQNQIELEIDNKFHQWPLKSTLNRLNAYDSLYEILSNKTQSHQRDIINQIKENLALEADEPDKHRMMNTQELKRLEENGLITVGGHTHNCVKLSLLDERRQFAEISKNKDILEETLGHKVEYFSYPFGSESGSHQNGLSRILEDSGFCMALGGCYGKVETETETNRYDLPRVKVGNWDLHGFHRFLTKFLD